MCTYEQESQHQKTRHCLRSFALRAAGQSPLQSPRDFQGCSLASLDHHPRSYEHLAMTCHTTHEQNSPSMETSRERELKRAFPRKTWKDMNKARNTHIQPLTAYASRQESLRNYSRSLDSVNLEWIKAWGCNTYLLVSSMVCDACCTGKQNKQTINYSSVNEWQALWQHKTSVRSVIPAMLPLYKSSTKHQN